MKLSEVLPTSAIGIWYGRVSGRGRYSALSPNQSPNRLTSPLYGQVQRKASTWHLDETLVRIRWMYLFHAVDSSGQTVDFYLSETRDREAAKCFPEAGLGEAGRQGAGHSSSQRHFAGSVDSTERVTRST